MKINQIFDAHKIPETGLVCRCHVLRESERGALLKHLTENLADCYISKDEVAKQSKKSGKSKKAVIANKLPDPGSVMSGDFGEILSLFYLLSENPEGITPIKKWRYKQDRKKPAPHTDVILLYRENGKFSKKDFVICAESKQKATASAFDPIGKSIAGATQDQTGRLARTLAWLHEKAIDHGTEEEVSYIERFSHDLTVPFEKRYKAIAVIDRALLDAELTRTPAPVLNGTFEAIVLGIADLKIFYESIFSDATREDR